MIFILSLVFTAVNLPVIFFQIMKSLYNENTIKF